MALISATELALKMSGSEDGVELDCGCGCGGFSDFGGELNEGVSACPLTALAGDMAILAIGEDNVLEKMSDERRCLCEVFFRGVKAVSGLAESRPYHESLQLRLVLGIEDIIVKEYGVFVRVNAQCWMRQCSLIDTSGMNYPIGHISARRHDEISSPASSQIPN